MYNYSSLRNKGLCTLSLYTILFAFFCSCKKYVQVDPPATVLVNSTVFENEATATAAILGIYSKMMESSNNFSQGSQSFTLLSGLYSDEFNNYFTTSNEIQFYTNSLNSLNARIQSLFKEPYIYIYNANAAIEGLEHSKNISSQARSQLEGEAKFIRAFWDFYLVNSFGDIPLSITTDYQINDTLQRTNKTKVYQQIISDLTDAKNLLIGDYSYSNGERIRPNKWAASALLSRVYLYVGDFNNAQTQATSLINLSNVYKLDSNLNNVFLKGSQEAIWQLKPVVPGFNTFDGNVFILTTNPTKVAISSYLLNSFEVGDKRKSSWIATRTSGSSTYYYPYKYKVKTSSTLTEYLVVLRLSEQYLIRAEARAKLGDLTGAISDLNIIRNRAGLSPLSNSLTVQQILNAVEQENRIEFFAEWGHRWLDMKRLGKADATLSSIKGANWQPTDTLFPIPQQAILTNPNLSQNLGY